MEPMELEETRKQSRGGMEAFFWLQAIVWALVIIVLVFTFFGRIIAVEGSSMVPTLQEGDRLLLQSIGYTPEAGQNIITLCKDKGRSYLVMTGNAYGNYSENQYWHYDDVVKIFEYMHKD